MAQVTLAIELRHGLLRTRYQAKSTSTRSRSIDAKLLPIVRLVKAWNDGRKIDRRTVEGLLPTTPPFHAVCWRAALKIPRGETRTYAWLAAAAGRPAAHRAAAQAMARNPLAPLVPCHRVVGAHGIGGFCGTVARTHSSGAVHWALALKARLLEFETGRRLETENVSYTSAPLKVVTRIKREKTR